VVTEVTRNDAHGGILVGSSSICTASWGVVQNPGAARQHKGPSWASEVSKFPASPAPFNKFLFCFC
jgi:hypothetical protein